VDGTVYYWRTIAVTGQITDAAGWETLSFKAKTKHKITASSWATYLCRVPNSTLRLTT